MVEADRSKPEREVKHMTISNSISRVVYSVQQLAELLDHFVGRPSEAPEPSDEVTLSLVGFLDNAPSRLNALSDKLNELREGLREALL